MTMVRRLFPIFLLALATAGAGCREDGDIQISSLNFTGVEQVDTDALVSALQTRRGSRLPWGRKRYFDRRAFDTDLKRIEAFYTDRGFPDARVTSFDVSLSDAQDKVDITVNISEGEPIRVAAVELVGFDPLTDDEREALQESLLLRVDAPFDRTIARTARERALNILRDKGYPYAEVTIAEEEAGEKRRRVLFEATPGILAHFGSIAIEGEASVDEHIIRRQLTFAPGDVFSRTEMRESQRKLYGLELFEFVNVQSQEDETPQAPEVPVRVTVAEGKHQRVTFGAGYGTEEQARARVRWDHNNFTGNARHAGFEGKWSSLDRGVRAEYREPFFVSPHFSLNFDGQAWQAAEPVYDLDSLGGRVTLRHQANTQNVWSVAFINEYQRSTVAPEALLDFTIRDELIALGLDPTDGTFMGTVSAVAFDISRNTSNNVLDARSGYALSAHVEQAGQWLPGTFNYWAVSGEGRHYLPVGDLLVVANRMRVGTIDAAGTLGSDVPFYKRYFLGGSASIRGWGRFEVGPTSGFGLPIGGHTMLEGSTELRTAAFGKFGVVAFADYGNVWSRSWEFDVKDLRYAVGPGLRYLTPVGPARVDFGYQLNPIEGLRVNGEPEKRHWRIHFSIGQAF
jgi:outer membrane protein insertion porin family/translocation and assembly module TamA